MRGAIFLQKIAPRWALSSHGAEREATDDLPLETAAG
jgi:hypothetical protein